jgi:hypothetical protein
MRNYETKIYDYVDKETGAHVVKAQTMYAGKTVCATAKCDPTDEFNLELGIELAMKRLDLKIAKKRAASMKEYVKYCKMNLECAEIEKRRIKTAYERANVAHSDRLVEAKQLEEEIKELLKDA